MWTGTGRTLISRGYSPKVSFVTSGLRTRAAFQRDTPERVQKEKISKIFFSPLVFPPFPISAFRLDRHHLSRAEFTSDEMPKSLPLLDRGVCRQHARRVFRLWDKVNHIAYEGFDLNEVKDGDTIQVSALRPRAPAEEKPRASSGGGHVSRKKSAPRRSLVFG